MPNPLAIAIRGKGVIPMLARGVAIARRYGLSAAKMEAALALFSSVLREFECRGSFPVTASALFRRPGLAQKMHRQGHELAIHGLVHVDYRGLSLEQQRGHLRKALKIFTVAGIRPTGFRCPYLRWNDDTIIALQELGFDYESSQALAWESGRLENDAYRRALDFYGTRLASQVPSLPWLEGTLVRIPYCLPDDEALIERFRLQPSKPMAEVWLDILERVYAAGELFTLGLHPERAPLCADALQAVLTRARSFSPGIWIARLNEIATWQRDLGQASFTLSQTSKGRFHVAIQVPGQSVILARSVELEIASVPWGHGYRSIAEKELFLRCSQRPLIGLASECSPNLKKFLQHQGYLFETGRNSSDYSFYLQKKTFEPADQRRLLVEIESGDWPLVRIGRWPNGARAALSVTGDVDALTLWDYVQRLGNR